MKKIVATLSIIAITLFFVSFSYAEEDTWSCKAKVYKFIPSDSDNIVQSAIGFQAQAIHKRTGLYPYSSYENIPLRFGGQSGRGSEVELWSAGIGIEKQIVKGLNCFCQVGWYQPKIDGQDKVLWKDHIAEGLALHLNNRLDPTPATFWEYYSVEYSGNIAGEKFWWYSGLRWHKNKVLKFINQKKKRGGSVAHTLPPTVKDVI